MIMGVSTEHARTSDRPYASHSARTFIASLKLISGELWNRLRCRLRGGEPSVNRPVSQKAEGCMNRAWTGGIPNLPR